MFCFCEGGRGKTRDKAGFFVSQAKFGSEKIIKELLAKGADKTAKSGVFFFFFFFFLFLFFCCCCCCCFVLFL